MRKSVKYVMDYSKLQGLIKEKLHSNKNLAKKVNISEAHLSNILNGRAVMDQPLINDIARVLGIIPDHIGVYFFTVKVCDMQTNE